MSTPLYRINSQIRANEVRLLAADGTQIGVVSLQDALLQAKALGVDAVEIAPTATPPVVKLIDYKKLLYQLAKKERAAKSATKKVELKEIRMTPFMAENDFQTRINRGKDFLTDGHKLRITVKFSGRQLSHKEFGDIMFKRTVAALSDLATVEQTPKWVGKQYIGTVSPVKKKLNPVQTNETKN